MEEEKVKHGSNNNHKSDKSPEVLENFDEEKVEHEKQKGERQSNDEPVQLDNNNYHLGTLENPGDEQSENNERQTNYETKKLDESNKSGEFLQNIDEAEVETNEPVNNYDEEKYIAMTKREKTPMIRLATLGFVLEKLDLNYYGVTLLGFTVLSDVLRFNTFIKILDLSNNHLTEKHCIYLNEIFEDNDTIEVVILKNCGIENESFQTLKNGIEQNRRIVSYDFSSNNLTDKCFQNIEGAPGASSYANKRIQKLALSNNSFEIVESGIVEFVAALALADQITELDLSWNCVYYEGLRNLMVLSTSKNLKMMNLAWNSNFDLNCVKVISAFVKQNESLEFLDLSFNNVSGEASSKLISKALVENQTLNYINLSGNSFTEIDTFLLVESFSKNNTGVKTLNLSDKYLNKKCVKLITNAENLKKVIKFREIVADYVINEPNYDEILLKRLDYLIRQEAMKPKKETRKKKKQRKNKRERQNFNQFLDSTTEPITIDDFMTKFKKNVSKKIAKKEKPLLSDIANHYKIGKSSISIEKLKDNYLKINMQTSF